MRSVESSLPWSGASVRTTGELRSSLAAALPPALCYHLPRSVVLLTDPAIPEITVSEWLAEVAEWLITEFSTREKRRRDFERYGKLRPDEMTEMLTAEHKQPWVLYFSEGGGLGPTQTVYCGDKEGGVVPCSSMRNHGVAWTRRRGEATSVWLVTARKEGQAWDLDSDIGHESAHASFAPVPLFAQSFPGDLDTLSLVRAKSNGGFTPHHLARMCYLYTELAVVAVRGERRDTESGLPVPTLDDLEALLEWSMMLLPDCGFDRALEAWKRNGSRVDPVSGPEIWEIGAAALRALTYTKPFLADPDVSGVFDAILRTGNGR